MTDKFIVRDNTGRNITHYLDEDEYGLQYETPWGHYLTDKAKGLQGLEQLVNDRPAEASLPGGFTLEMIPDVKPVVMARYTKNRKKIDKGVV